MNDSHVVLFSCIKEQSKRCKTLLICSGLLWLCFLALYFPVQSNFNAVFTNCRETYDLIVQNKLLSRSGLRSSPPVQPITVALAQIFTLPDNSAEHFKKNLQTSQHSITYFASPAAKPTFRSVCPVQAETAYYLYPPPLQCLLPALRGPVSFSMPPPFPFSFSAFVAVHLA